MELLGIFKKTFHFSDVRAIPYLIFYQLSTREVCFAPGYPYTPENTRSWTDHILPSWWAGNYSVGSISYFMKMLQDTYRNLDI